MIDTELTKRVNVMKLVSFDVQSIRDMLIELNSTEFDYTPTDEEVMQVIEREASESFSCGWGHNANLNDLIFQNEDGEDI